MSGASVTVPSAGDDAGRRKPDDTSNDDQFAVVTFTDDQIGASGIELAPVHDGMVAHRIIVPGAIVPHADRIARVSVELSATVVELRKKLGDSVTKGEIVAVIESREIANAKSEYLEERLIGELQEDLYDRDEIPWDRRAISEQPLLQSLSVVAAAKMKLDIARRKLFALGVPARAIGALADDPEADLGRLEVLAPMSGRIVDRKVDLGAMIGRDNLETELFTIANLDRVWVWSSLPSVQPTFRWSGKAKPRQLPRTGRPIAPSAPSCSSVRCWTVTPVSPAWWRRSATPTACGGRVLSSAARSRSRNGPPHWRCRPAPFRPSARAKWYSCAQQRDSKNAP
jgi:hypothetical protein